MKILVVDDVSDIRRLVRAYLHRPPNMLVVGEAADGLEAIRLASEIRPDVIVLDRLMDPMGGDAALPLLRGTLPDAAIVAYSSFADPAERAALRELGADALVAKHAGLDRLEAAIREAVAARMAGRDWRGRPRIAVVDDSADVRRALRQLLDDEGFEVVVDGPGEAADLDAVAAARPHAVVLDWVLRGVRDGSGAASYLRRVIPHVPVVVLTAYPDRVGGLAAPLGITSVLTKDLAAKADLPARLRKVIDDAREASRRRCSSYQVAAGTHERAAETHERAAGLFEGRGLVAKAEAERLIAQRQRDRAAAQRAKIVAEHDYWA